MGTDKEINVASHYTTDNLLGRIKSALVTAGSDPENLQAHELKGVD